MGGERDGKKGRLAEIKVKGRCRKEIPAFGPVVGLGRGVFFRKRLRHSQKVGTEPSKKFERGQVS